MVLSGITHTRTGMEPRADLTTHWGPAWHRAIRHEAGLSASDITSMTTTLYPDRNPHVANYTAHHLYNVSMVAELWTQGYDTDVNCSDWNNSLCVQNHNATDPMSIPQSPRTKYWVLMLLVFPLLTIFGNLLICLAVYRERQLRTVTNYFIVSLAVADIMVATLVMPLAVYVEAVDGVWQLGNALCDMFVAFDVMCCTASILNLTAISIDRFLAVTRPIQYATYKASNRVWLMLAGVWLISIAISSPIPLGMNYTEHRVPELCTFYNSDFIIYSSMGSFWIPCIVMILLYYQIFKVIRERASRTKRRAREKDVTRYTEANIITNRTRGTHSSSENSNVEEKAQLKLERTVLTSDPAANCVSKRPHKPVSANGRSETIFINALAQKDDKLGPRKQCDAHPTVAESDPENVIVNHGCADGSEEECPGQIELSSLMLSPAHSAASTNPCATANETWPSSLQPCAVTPTTFSNTALLSPPSPHKQLLSYQEQKHKEGRQRSTKSSENNHNGSPKKYVTKFNFNLRHNSRKKKKKERSNSNKKERKATRTLAIVLGMFLLCWVPFFTINIFNAICIKFDIMDNPECSVDPILFSLFVWLGYINSFMNPVIYTIFNLEFRKAFKKLITQPC